MIDQTYHRTPAAHDGIDQRLMDAYDAMVIGRVRRGIIDCEEPREDETVEAFMRRKLAEAGIEVPA